MEFQRVQIDALLQRVETQRKLLADKENPRKKRLLDIVNDVDVVQATSIDTLRGDFMRLSVADPNPMDITPESTE